MSQPVALILSILIEGGVAALMLWRLRWGAPWRGAAAALVGTLVTHWAVWAVMPPLIEEIGYWPTLLIVEGCVVLVETVAYRFVGGLTWRRALTASFAANLASTLAGLVIYYARVALR